MPSPPDLLRRVFGGGLGARVHLFISRHYRSTFESKAGQIVLGDLGRFCNGYETTHIPGDPYTSAVEEGRRQVLLRIIAYTNVNPDQLLRLAAETQRAEQEILRVEED